MSGRPIASLHYWAREAPPEQVAGSIHPTTPTGFFSGANSMLRRLIPLTLLLPLVLGAIARAVPEPASSPPASEPSGGSEPAPASAAAALLVPVGGALGQVILPQTAGADGVRIRLTSSRPEIISV